MSLRGKCAHRRGHPFFLKKAEIPPFLRSDSHTGDIGHRFGMTKTAFVCRLKNRCESSGFKSSTKSRTLSTRRLRPADKRGVASHASRASRCSALIVLLRRAIRTFAGREVFSPTHMSPWKMDWNSFAPAGANSARLCLPSEKPLRKQRFFHEKGKRRTGSGAQGASGVSAGAERRRRSWQPTTAATARVPTPSVRRPG